MTEATQIFERFFEDVVPVMFQATTEVFPVPGMEGTTFTLQVKLTGESGTEYGITIEDAKKITVTPGGIDSPMLTVELPASIFLDMIKKTITSPLQDMYSAAKDVAGTMVIDPKIKDGSPPMRVKIVFNQAADPSIELRADVPTFIKLMNGELSPPTAFMQGSLKIDGNLPFGMELMSKFAALIPG
jgi:putative sterol carrier protein